jgi:membrane AbrB-like protein
LSGATPKPAAQAIETALLGAGGAALFVLLGIPAGAILGALLATAGASLAGRRLGWPDAMRTALFMTMGYSAGASATPAALSAALLWPLSLLALLATTAAIWFAGWLVFRRLSPTDGRTAFYAASPGALSTVMILAEQQGTDVSKVAVAQSLRLLILVCLSPLATLAGHPAALPPGAPVLIDGLWGWAVALAAVLAGWGIMARLNWPAAAFMGAMFGSVAVHATGLVHAAPPHEVLLVAGAMLGALIGSRFVGLRFADLAREGPACLALVAVMTLIGAPIGLLVGTAVGVGALAGVMAFAPGSMEVMVAVSLAFNAHPDYVAAHHLTRTLLLIAAMPALAVLTRRREPPRA